MITEKILLWEDRDDVQLHTFLAEADPVLPGEKEPLPAMIVCPGGAYVYCSKLYEGDGVAMHYAAAGYQTFVLLYTVASSCGIHSARYPAQLLDLGKAILTIREHAKEWNIDTDRICVTGFSAGAHLAGTLATHWHEDILSGYFHTDPEVFRPKAVVLGYPLTDYRYQEAYNATQPPNPLLLTSNQMFLGTEHPTDAQLEEVSTCLHVSEHTPPIFLAHAANDSMVPVTHSLEMARALKEQNRPFELHIFEHGEHGFASGVPVGINSYRLDQQKACAQWLPLAKRWLLQQIAPETAEKDISAEEIFGDNAPPLPRFCV